LGDGFNEAASEVVEGFAEPVLDGAGGDAQHLGGFGKSEALVVMQMDCLLQPIVERSISA
jgi:hypothetical protein